MSPSPQWHPREPVMWRWAGLLAALLLAGALGGWLLPPDGVVTDCERDGHFQRIGQVACGLAPVNAPYGPLLPWLGAALVPFAGTPYLAGRLLGLLSFLGIVALSGRAAARFGAGTVAATLAAALVALNPHLLLYGTMACTDVPASFLWLSALYLAAQAVETRGVGWRAGAAGAIGALAVLVRVQWLLPLVALAGLLSLLTPGGARVRLGALGLFLGGVALPLGIAVAFGLQRYPDLHGVLGEYLGGLAFSRAVPRLGALVAGGAPVEGAPGFGARLAWSAWLAARVGGGVPLGALAVGLGLAWGRRVRPWRAVLLVVLACAACWAATAWSHPPPDLGARRFFLALIPPGIVLGVGLLAGLRPWSARVATLAAAFALLAATAFLGAELGSLRGVEVCRGWAGLPLPRPLDRADAVDRAALRAGEWLLSAEAPGCAPIYTNYHNAAPLFWVARFLGHSDLAAAAASLPGLAPGARAYLLWVPPPGVEVPEPSFPRGLAALPLPSAAGVATFRLTPAASGGPP